MPGSGGRREETEMPESNKFHEFRNCHEAGMDYDTAVSCAGLDHQREHPMLRKMWEILGRNYEAAEEE